MHHPTTLNLEHLLILLAFLSDRLTVPQACGLFIPGEQEKLILTNHIFFFPYCLDQNLKSEIQENKILLTQRPPLSPSSDFVLSGEHWLCLEFKISVMNLKSYSHRFVCLLFASLP